MKLKYQLFLTLLCLSAILILLTYALNSWSFNRGFLNYLNNVELQRLDTLVSRLESEYQSDPDWKELASQRDRWRSITREEYLQQGRGSRRDRTRRDAKSKLSDDTLPGPSRPPKTPLIVLTGVEKNVLIGPKRIPNNMNWRSLKVDDELVGYVGTAPRRELTNELDKIFSKQQTRSFAVAGLAMVLVSVLAATLLSSRIVRPIVRIKQAVSNISNGQFESRISERRNDELGELSSDINHLALTLEKNLQLRQRFLAEISHELRTPVAILQGEIEAIQDRIKEPTEAAIDSLHSETLRLSRLINDLQDLSATDIGSLNYRMGPLNLIELINSRLETGATQLSAKSISVNIQTDANETKISGDEQRLEQLIDNLLQNSIRYTHADGQIDIQLTTDDNNLKLTWSDSTPGVNTDQLSHLFDSLYRTEDSRNREQGGLWIRLGYRQENCHRPSRLHRCDSLPTRRCADRH